MVNSWLSPSNQKESLRILPFFCQFKPIYREIWCIITPLHKITLSLNKIITVISAHIRHCTLSLLTRLITSFWSLTWSKTIIYLLINSNSYWNSRYSLHSDMSHVSRAGNSLAGKVVFVTGASRGIGLSIAKKCAQDGWDFFWNQVIDMFWKEQKLLWCLKLVRRIRHCQVPFLRPQKRLPSLAVRHYL